MSEQQHDKTTFNEETGLFRVNLTEFCGLLEKEYRDCVAEQQKSDNYSYGDTYSVVCAKPWHILSKCMSLKYRYLTDFYKDQSHIEIKVDNELINEWYDEDAVSKILDDDREKRQKDFRIYVNEEREKKKRKEEQKLKAKGIKKKQKAEKF